MDSLNKGRCSRCIASKSEIILSDQINKKGIELKSKKIRKWLKCFIYNNWCRNRAFICKEPPMGISADDYKLKVENK